MAIPVLPLVLIGVGVFVLRGRRRRTKKKTEGEVFTAVVRPVVFIPPEDREPHPAASWEPGEPCEAADGRGAWTEQGECRTFWVDGVTDDAIAALAREEWEARGRPGFSELCLAVYDELGGEFATHGANPRFTEIVVAVLQRYYSVGSVFPPVRGHSDHEPSSPYWVHEAWAKAQHVVRQELCGG